MKTRNSIILYLSLSVALMVESISNSQITEDISAISQINNTDDSISLSQSDSGKTANITQIGSENNVDAVNGNQTAISQTGNQNIVNSSDTNSFSVYQRGDLNDATVTGNSGSVLIRQIGFNNISTVSQ